MFQIYWLYEEIYLDITYIWYSQKITMSQ